MQLSLREWTIKSIQKYNFLRLSITQDSLSVLCQSWYHLHAFNRLSILCHADELIVAVEHFAEIGDDLDFTFVDLIEGVEPIWTYRRPKPPTPPPREPSPAKAVAATVEGAAPGAAAAEAPSGEPGAEGEAPSAVVTPPKEPSPFELKKHFPPDGAEVPFVASHEDGSAPAPAPSPSPAPEEKAPTPAPEPEPVAEEAPAAEEPAPEAAAEEPAAEAPAE